MSKLGIITGAAIFSIDEYVALITYEYDYMHIGLVGESRFSSVKRVDNLEELVQSYQKLEQFKLSDIIDNIMAKKNIEVILGCKYDGLIIFVGTMEDLFYTVIGGDKYMTIEADMIKFEPRSYLDNADSIINRDNRLEYMHEFKECRCINEAVANTLEFSEDDMLSFIEYTKDLECDCTFTDSGILEELDGGDKTLSLVDNPFRLIAKNALRNCNICDLCMDSECLWESEAIVDCNIGKLVIDDCKIFNDDFILSGCSIDKLVVRSKQTISKLMKECHIKEIVLSDKTITISPDSFLNCLIDSIDLNKVEKISEDAFAGCKFKQLDITNNVKVLKAGAFRNTEAEVYTVDLSGAKLLAAEIFQGSSVYIDTDISKDISYASKKVFEGSYLRRLVNKSILSLDLRNCMHLEELETSGKCLIEGTNIKKLKLCYTNILSDTVHMCSKLERIEIEPDSETKLKIDIDFIKGSTLNELCIKSGNIDYIYSQNNVTEELFIETLRENVGNENLQITVNDKVIDYKDSEIDLN